MRRFLVLAALCVSVTVCGCVRQNVPVQFDSSDPLALNPEIQWAVVTEPYVACYQNADYASAVLTHFRKGEILQVIGEKTVRIDDAKEIWFAFSDGWMPASSVAVYANKMRAKNAVRQMGVK